MKRSTFPTPFPSVLTSLFATFAAFFCSTAFAGWTSGGGELHRYDENPWFLYNTPVVEYCIMKDAEHFPVSDEAIQAAIQQAITYWRGELGRLHDRMRTDMRYRLATQQFVRAECAETTDLVYQFGTLSEIQLTKMRQLGMNPTDFVSLAVRTEYDRINLMGKGFIYVAPESGALRPPSDSMMERPWSSNSGRLEAVLMHEMGHVFGFQHFSSMYGGGVMRADLAAAVVDPEWEDYDFSDFWPTMLTHKANVNLTFFEGIRSFVNLKTVTQAPESTRCIRLTGLVDFLQIRVQRSDDCETFVDWGEIAPGFTSSAPGKTRAAVHLPPEQTVFESFGKWVNLADEMVWTFDAYYEDRERSVQKGLIVRYGPDEFRISGELDKMGHAILAYDLEAGPRERDFERSNERQSFDAQRTTGPQNPLLYLRKK